jgi:hypothetical protein
MKWILALSLVLVMGCGDDGGDGIPPLSVGSECTESSECDEDNGQTCLAGFKGGYCGIADCGASDQCPEGSGCALYENGVGYCFRTCVVSADCNDFRSADTEADCSESAPFLDDIADLMACVPQAMQ